MTDKDAFDLFWQWALKPHESGLTIDSDIHHAVTSLPREDWRDRDKVNAAVAVQMKKVRDAGTPRA